ncbi:glutamate--tRNA ligase [Plakobranchus ocellatus]|uniref:Glutamate--tRNA ligase n=1 Tax=Plakobranchus ocellatus TaxID=259542 RepID=A0AAV3YWB0_9GAST|nr:glutamate--tRNA ligase [Plakobranchus ocellatus]
MEWTPVKQETAHDSGKFSTKVENNVRVRFAPSPTGFMHLGGLRTALYNFLFARANQGKFILRIEDTDQNRAVPGAIEKLEETLQWAQVNPDEGPSAGGSYGPYIQSQRLDLYQEHVQTLLSSGSAYRCFCSARRLELMRKEAARRGEPSRYDGKCRGLTEEAVKKNLDQGLPHTIRLKLKPTPEPWDDLIKGKCSHDIFDIEGDPILLKSDGYPTYHFANVVDDHLMRVTHVLRGSVSKMSSIHKF